MKIPLLLTLIVAMAVPSLSGAAPSPPPPRDEQFMALSPAELAQLLSKSAWAGTQELVHKHGCSAKDMAGFHSRNSKSKVVVVTVPCDPPQGLAETDDRYSAYREYPLTIVILGDSVTEVNFDKYGFMYETGQIAFITDIDKNNMPEFWLTGAVCECDDEQDKNCDCDSGITVEFTNGTLQPWKKQNGW